MNQKIKLLSDSSCDLTQLEDISFSVAPLTITAGENNFVDNENLDINNMLEVLQNYNGKSSTSCPSVNDWLENFEDADIIYVVAMTSGLSGTYNSACSARELYLESHPDTKIHVFDTLSTGPEQALIINKLVSLIKQNTPFEETVELTNNYMKHTGLLFSLESLHNFAQNGRVSKVTAAAVGVLGIRIVGTASNTGTLQVISKCRGEKKAQSTLIEQLKATGYKGGKISISHVNNIDFANNLKNELIKEYPNADIIINKARGLCSYYAENGGLLVGYEKI